MSEEAEKSAAPAVPGAKPPKVVLALLALNLAASGLGAFKLMTARPAAAAARHAEPAPPPTDEVVGPVIALDPFVVNLDETGQSRYLKVTFQAEVHPRDGEAVLNKSKQLVRDTILSHLSGLKLADTLGAEAKAKIREDLLEKLERLVGPHKVRRLFYQEFVVQ